MQFLKPNCSPFLLNISTPFNCFIGTLLYNIIVKSSVLLFHYYAMRWSCIISIIIFRVSFCSDIWYCNILAYYLDN